MPSKDDLQSKKLQPLLAELLRQKGQAHADRLRVLIRLAGYQLPPREPGLPRAQHVERCQQAFDKVARPVKGLVERLGGTVEAPGAWLTGSLCAELPPDAIPAVLESNEVESVDLVRRILPEALPDKLPAAP